MFEFFPCHSQLNNYNYGHTFLKASDFTERQKSWAWFSGLRASVSLRCPYPIKAPCLNGLGALCAFLALRPPSVLGHGFLFSVRVLRDWSKGLKQQQFGPKRWWWCVWAATCKVTGGTLQPATWPQCPRGWRNCTNTKGWGHLREENSENSVVDSCSSYLRAGRRGKGSGACLCC